MDFKKANRLLNLEKLRNEINARAASRARQVYSGCKAESYLS
jgi:hypothetical protein